MFAGDSDQTVLVSSDRGRGQDLPGRRVHSHQDSTLGVGPLHPLNQQPLRLKLEGAVQGQDQGSSVGRWLHRILATRDGDAPEAPLHDLFAIGPRQETVVNQLHAANALGVDVRPPQDGQSRVAARPDPRSFLVEVNAGHAQPKGRCGHLVGDLAPQPDELGIP